MTTLDPDFTRDAWGGPSYLGASVTHWFDLALLLYAAVAVIAMVSRRQLGRRQRLLGAPAPGDSTPPLPSER